MGPLGTTASDPWTLLGRAGHVKGWATTGARHAPVLRKEEARPNHPEAQDPQRLEAQSAPIAVLAPATLPLSFAHSFLQCRPLGTGLRSPNIHGSYLDHACCMCLPEVQCMLCIHAGHMHRTWRIYYGLGPGGPHVRMCMLAQAQAWCVSHGDAHACGSAQSHPLCGHRGTCMDVCAQIPPAGTHTVEH